MDGSELFVAANENGFGLSVVESLSFGALKEPKVLLKGAADVDEAVPVAFEALKGVGVLVEPNGLLDGGCVGIVAARLILEKGFLVASLLSLPLLLFVSVGLVERALKAGREPPTVDVDS